MDKPEFNSDLAGQMAERAAITDKLVAAGVNPFNNSFKTTCQLHEIIEYLDVLPGLKELSDNDQVFHIAGRIMGIRNMGKLCFYDLPSPYIVAPKEGVQVMISAKDCPTFGLTEFIQKGDFVGVIGKAFCAKNFRLTIFAQELVLLTKAARPPVFDPSLPRAPKLEEL